MEESRPRGRRRIWLEAERYHVREVPDIYRPHPEGLPDIARNCLVVGYPGVGKTMILKKLCADLYKDPTVLPIYVQIEPWAAKISGETTYPVDRRKTPRDREVLKSCTILLALAIVERVQKYGDPSLVRAATDMFPLSPEPKADLRAWIDTPLSAVRRVLEDGDELSPDYATFPSLFDIANAVGQASRVQNKTLVLLIDQVDKTSAPHFNAVASLLRRGDFVVVMATRPCPAAPGSADIPAGIVSGNDYAIHWVGIDPRSQAWRRFIQSVVEDAQIEPSVRERVIRELSALTSLVGPSARKILALCLDLERRITLAQDQSQAWNEALISLLETEEAVAIEILGAWCSDARRVLSKLRDRAAEARRREKAGPGPAAVRIRQAALVLPESVEAFLRVCTREGMLLPRSRAQHGLDGLVDVYEVNPLLVAPRDPRAVEHFHDSLVEFDVSGSDLEKWTTPSRQRHLRQSKQVFVSFWMSGPRAAGLFPDRLKKRLLGRAQVVTGERLHGSPQWSPEIRALIKDSDVVVLDLTTPRRDVFVEWGWAIGAKRPVLLCAKDDQGRDSSPRWVRERQIRPYDSDADFDQLVSSVIYLLDNPHDRITTWKDDPSGRSLDYKPSARSVAFIGATHVVTRLESLCQAAARENGFTFDSVTIGSGAEEAGVLFQVIATARKAGTLVLVFDGTDTSDLLTCTAGGVFTTTDSISVGGRKPSRKLFLVSVGGSQQQLLPGLLRTKPGVVSERNFDELTGLLRDHLARLNRTIREARPRAKRST